MRFSPSEEEEGGGTPVFPQQGVSGRLHRLARCSCRPNQRPEGQCPGDGDGDGDSLNASETIPPIGYCRVVVLQITAQVIFRFSQ